MHFNSAKSLVEIIAYLVAGIGFSAHHWYKEVKAWKKDTSYRRADANREMDKECLSMLEQLGQTAGLTQPPQLFMQEGGDNACALSDLNGKSYLGMGTAHWSEMNQKEREGTIGHELGHILCKHTLFSALFNTSSYIIIVAFLSRFQSGVWQITQAIISLLVAFYVSHLIERFAHRRNETSADDIGVLLSGSDAMGVSLAAWQMMLVSRTLSTRLKKLYPDLPPGLLQAACINKKTVELVFEGPYAGVPGRWGKFRRWLWQLHQGYPPLAARIANICKDAEEITPRAAAKTSSPAA